MQRFSLLLICTHFLSACVLWPGENTDLPVRTDRKAYDPISPEPPKSGQPLLGEPHFALRFEYTNRTEEPVRVELCTLEVPKFYVLHVRGSEARPKRMRSTT